MSGEEVHGMFDSVFDARELIGQAVGAGSVCWENPAGAGVFDSTMAAEVADAAWNRLRILLAERPEKSEQRRS